MKVLRRDGQPDLVVPSESIEQRKLFAWAKHADTRYPPVNLMYAVPNGGSRQVVEAAIMKAEGVMPGVPDINLPWPNDTHAGLCIELKRVAFALHEKNPTQFGTISEDQLKWLVRLNAAGHHAVVCRGCEHAQATVEAYCLDDEPRLAYLNQWWVDLDPKMLKRVTKAKVGGTRKRKPALRRRAVR